MSATNNLSKNRTSELSQHEYTWVVPSNHPAFAGHFPAHPIVPGVVILNHALRQIELLLGLKDSNWQIINTKFFSPVAPNETLIFTFQKKIDDVITYSVVSQGKKLNENKNVNVSTGAIKLVSMYDIKTKT